MVGSDGAPQVSKPAMAPAGAGGGEEDGPGAGCVGTAVPVGVGVGQEGGIQVGGIQVGGATSLGGADACGTAEAATTSGRGDPCAPRHGQGRGVGVIPDRCLAEFAAAGPAAAACAGILCTPPRAPLIPFGLG